MKDFYCICLEEMNSRGLQGYSYLLPSYTGITAAAIFAILLNVELRMVLLYEEGFSFI